MTAAVLFDLGNTLAAYYHASEFQPILAQAIRAVRDELASRGRDVVSLEAALHAAALENREAADYRFMPLLERLARIFRVSFADDAALAAAVCERFLAPIFAVGRVYADTLPALEQLRQAGVRTAIVSNAPWGSPPQSWRRELERLTLASAVDAVVMCGDVGWRKPAPEIFRHAARALGVAPQQCVFVGDDPHWDVQGSESVGMRAVLIDRDGRHPGYVGERVDDLGGLMALLAAA